MITLYFDTTGFFPETHCAKNTRKIQCIDFKEIKADDDLVKIYESLMSNQFALGKKKHTCTGGTAKKYYWWGLI